MAMIRYDDEKDLQRKICNRLNKYGYAFEKGPDNYFCDVFEPLVKAYCEVKTNGKFAPQQLLYGLAKEEVRDTQFLMLANEYELRIYKPPKFETILKFAKQCSRDLSRSPSSITAKKLVNEAFNILGNHLQIYNYQGEFKIDENHPHIFLNETNYEYFQMILIKYRINPAEFINTFAKTWVTKSQLHVKNDHQTIVDLESGRQVKAHRKIMDKFDRKLIESTRIRAKDIEKIIHRVDELAPIDVRRKRGKYWSSTNVSEIVTELVRDHVNPDFIFEPFVGGGSLIRDLIDECKGVVNDIDNSAIDLLEQEWEGYDWKYYRKNIHTTRIEEICSWIPEFTDDDTFCIYTNPPFGTSSTNALVSKGREVKNMAKKSTRVRKTKIMYGANEKESKYIGDKYGRGDLVLPSMGKMVEVIKKKGTGYLAFFSPFGVMLGRTKYNKLLRTLLKDFEFIYGEVFSGNMFNGVSKKKAISFTIWKYHENTNTSHESLTFTFYEKEYHLKLLDLLKDGWRYDTRKKIKGEVGIQHNETFNAAPPKMFHINVKKGGSELIPENVKIPLNVPNIPDELIYGLWSITVGNRSLTNCPIVFDNCYTHLPDFTNVKTMEILAYSLLSVVITELMNDYTNGKIGFVGMKRVFRFGGNRLTDGATHLVKRYEKLPVGKYTMGEVFDRLRQNEMPDEIDKRLRIFIKDEITKRLEQIGYWDYLPIPRIRKNV